jgi:arylformamidase
MTNENNWIDITITLEDGMVYWPDDIPAHFSKSASIEKDKVNVTTMHLSAHTGTHVDAPLHFLADGGDVSNLSLNSLIGRATIIEIKNDKAITLEEIKNYPIVKGDRILFKTRHSSDDWSMQPFQRDYVYVSEEAATYLAEIGIACVGIDYLSIAEFNNGEVVHRIFLESNIVIIEGLKLTGVDPGIYEMVCLPLKIKGADGSPVRVIIRKFN